MQGGLFICRTCLAPGVFEGVQIASSSTLEDACYLLESEDEVLVAYGNELECLETEEEED